MSLLVPAIAAKKRVVYATATNTLLDQLRLKDIPLLQSAGFSFKAVTVKGRSRYVCNIKADQEDIIRPAELVAWTKTTRTGDLADAPGDPSPEVIAGLVAGEDECAGKKCDAYWKCHYYAARESAPGADVVLTNHAVLAQHMATGRILPDDVQVIIVDEAHKFEATVRDSLKEEISLHAGQRALKLTQALGLPALDGATLQVRQAGNLFFKNLRHVLARRAEEGERTVVIDPEKLGAELPKLAEQYRAAVDLVMKRLEAFSNTEQCREAWAEVRSGLAALWSEDANIVCWAELGGETVTAYSAPVSVASYIRSRLSQHVVIYASATLATASGEDAFLWAREALGLQSPLELQVDSPFDYRRQLLYYLPEIELEEGWEKNPAVYARCIAPHIVELLDATEGRAFVLFTSYKELRATRRLVDCRWPIACQGDAPPKQLMEWFRRTRGAVLFATGAFWEGVDQPGQELSCVILVRIPFSPPSDPVAIGRARALGRKAFYLDSVPRATQTFKQGVGRLIRSEGDKGIIGAFDQRLKTKNYGQLILEALPGKPLPGYNTLKQSSLKHLSKFLHPDTRQEAA